jgi:hypothetical protein
MIEQPRTILVVLAGFALATSAFADMMPAQSVDAARGKSLSAVISEHSPEASIACLGIGNLQLPSIMPISESDADVGQVQGTQPPVILADRQNSFNLCLYALIGLGLCRSAPWVKKLSFCQIPDWYHPAGPYQIGHSHAIGPECLCSVAACFIQPDFVAEDSPPLYQKEVFISLWRKSQLTPLVLASCGPPIRTQRPA